ncbi:hypothetical protein TTRE_0000766501 [Trichuris trichiura]|uniref:HTH OST-type domain-containing protein n=1 Tax=Trichuris trichiura TaxID=36087 RepID=A0A077ZIB5_TRITR|nr:hypothetical protein TTRE_0000766501 [Trichuris trichiura]
MEEKENKALPVMVHSVLLTFKNGAKGSEFLTAYKDCAGGQFPMSENGFHDLPSLMRAMPDVVEIRKNKQGEELYVAKTLESTRSLQQLVAGQRAKDDFKRAEFKTRSQLPEPLPPKQPIVDPRLLPPAQPACAKPIAVAPKKKAKKKKKKKKKKLSGNLNLPVEAANAIPPPAPEAIGAWRIPCNAFPASAARKKLPAMLRVVNDMDWSWPTYACSMENRFLRLPRPLTVRIMNIKGPNTFTLIIKEKDIVEAVEQLTPLMGKNIMSTLGTRSHFLAGSSVLVPLATLEPLSPKFSKVPQRGFLADLVDVPPYCWDGFIDDFKVWLASEIAGRKLIAVPATVGPNIALGVEKVPIHLYVESIDPANLLNKKIARICRKIMLRCGNMDKVLSEVAGLKIDTFT